MDYIGKYRKRCFSLNFGVLPLHSESGRTLSLIRSFISNFECPHTDARLYLAKLLMMNAWKRLRKEKEQLPLSLSAKDPFIQLAVLDEENLLKWRAIIRGPPGTAYDGYIFKLLIEVPEEYPLVPPTMRFLTKIFHPNVHFKTGEICIDVLKKDWTPAWSLSSACRAIMSILSDPNAESPLNCDAGNMIRAGDYLAYESMARMYCTEHAIAVPDHVLPKPPIQHETAFEIERRQTTST